MKKALITGVTGQDGAYLSRLLLGEGYRVCGLVRDSTHPDLGNLRALGVEDRVEIVTVNLLDLSNVIAVLTRQGPQEVYHLAAQSSVGLSFQQPIGTMEFNVQSTLNLLEALRIARSSARFYHASSSEMFGRVQTLPVTEETALHPVSPYAVSKAAAHWATVNYRESYGLFACCGILFNHESALRGGQFVTKKIIAGALAISRGELERLSLGDLSVRRDWGYAPHYVRAMWLMLQQGQPDDYVIATGRSHSLEDFTRLAFAELGLDWRERVISDPHLARPSDISDIYGDPAKARRELGWHYGMEFPELVARLVAEEQALNRGETL